MYIQFEKENSFFCLPVLWFLYNGRQFQPAIVTYLLMNMRIMYKVVCNLIKLSHGQVTPNSVLIGLEGMIKDVFQTKKT